MTDRYHLNPACAAVLMLVAGMACAQTDFVDLREVGPVPGNPDAVRAKVALCSACHGPAGISVVPTFPSIAGQPAEYLYWQLVEFKREARADSPMTAIVGTLSDQEMRDYAAYFATLAPPQPQPQPASDNGLDIRRGATLFARGDVQAGIPPCQGCHGTDGSGHPLAAAHVRYRVYPVLRGQHSAYIAQRLMDFRNRRHTLSSSDRIMQGVAQNIGDADAQAIADWLQHAH